MWRLRHVGGGDAMQLQSKQTEPNRGDEWAGWLVGEIDRATLFGGDLAKKRGEERRRNVRWGAQARGYPPAHAERASCTEMLAKRLEKTRGEEGRKVARGLLV